jgi:tetratricopeptide (TPR) repeat protein
LKALQAHVSAARAAFDAGDRNKALEHLDRALSIDPSFLAAQSLRERILTKPQPVAMPPSTSPAPTPHLPPRRQSATREAYERIELRAKQRRVDHCIAATRAALGRQQPDAAAAALAELVALEPDESNVASLSAEVIDLRRRSRRRPFGVRFAAVAAFIVVAGTASWLERPARPPAPVAEITTSVRATIPAPSVQPVESAPEPAPVLESHNPIDVPDNAGRKAASERMQPRVLTPPPATLPRLAASVPERPVAPPTTAPLSLPVPLSQLPTTTAADVPRESTVAAVATAAPAVVPPPTRVPAAVPPPARVAGDQELVEEALQRYRRAYGRLNVQSAEAVYPTVNRVALARAFEGLESQALTFDSCEIELRGVLARAICHGTAHYVPKVGSRYPRTEPLVWSFELRKSDTDWTIYYAKASR